MEVDLLLCFTSQQSTRVLVQNELYNDQYSDIYEKQKTFIVDVGTVIGSDGC